MSASISQTHVNDGSTQSHAHQSKVTVSENKESLTILTYQNQLISVISAHTLSIAGVLREYGFISDEVFDRILHPSTSTPQENATILVNAVREKIKTGPKRFPELIRILSEQVSTKEIAEMLQSAYQDEIT